VEINKKYIPMSKIKNYEEYIEKARRTFPDLGKETNEVHMMSGMFTEKAEIVDVLKKKIAYGKDIDMVNIKEEVGDFMWYFANADYFMRQNEGFFRYAKYIRERIEKPNDLIPRPPVVKFTKVILKIEFGSFINKFSLLTAADFIIEVCSFFELDLIECMNLNYQKLLKRYPKGFDPDKAINRDLDVERNTLENNK